MSVDTIPSSPVPVVDQPPNAALTLETPVVQVSDFDIQAMLQRQVVLCGAMIYNSLSFMYDAMDVVSDE